MNLLEKLKWTAIRDNIVVPVMGRMGTAVAAYIATLGVGGEDAHKVGVGVAVFGCILYDLIVDWMARKFAERKGAEKATDPRTLAAIRQLEQRLRQ